MKITSILKIGRELSIIFDNGESSVLYPFGKTIYTTTSKNILKKDLIEFKKDVIKYDWNAQELEKIWIEQSLNKI